MKIINCLIFSLAALNLCAQPSLTWQKTYGGTNHEYIHQTIPTADGGFAFIGYSESSDGDLSQNQGYEDLWVAKADASGNLQWSHTYGGSEDEQGAAIVEGSDGCFYVAGWTESTDGDVSGLHGTYGKDMWLLKLSASGSLLKQKCLGGTSDEEAAALVAGPSGVLFAAGITYSYDGDVSGNHGSYETDAWVVKIDTALNLLAQRCVGGSDFEEAMGLVYTADGGVAITGRAYSTDGDITGYHDGSDMLIAKLTSTLTVEWAKCFGGSQTEEGNDIVQLPDQSFCVLGYTSTHNNGDVSGHHGAQGTDDFWLVKVSSTGTLEWARCYGGSGDDQANGLVLAADGGYAMCGLTNSNDGDVSGFHQGFFAPDYWVAKVDASGNFLWQRCCGGSDQDESFRIYEESPNVYIVCGFTYSPDGDVTNWKGDADGWIIRVTGAVGIGEDGENAAVSVYPNPADKIVNFSGMDAQRIRLWSASGSLCYEADAGKSISVEALSPGVYFLELMSEDIIITRKLQIIHRNQ